MSPPLVVDYAWARLDPKAIRAAGYVGVVRYLSNDPTKNLSAAELEQLHAEGLAVGVVWEAGATDELGGQAAGERDGGLAQRLADALGWPDSRPIYYAADFAAQGGQLATCAAYLAGVKRTSGRPVGEYGSIATVDLMLAEGHAAFGWQTSAWSSGRVSAHANLYQRQSPTRTIAGAAPGSFDEDVALKADWGGWDGTKSPTSPAPKQPVYVVAAPSGAVVFEADYEGRRWQVPVHPA